MSDETNDETPSASKAAPKPSAPVVTAEHVEYVVQFLRRDFVFEGNEHSSPTTEIAAWVDLATIKLPPRSHRSKAIKLALVEAGIKPTPGAKLEVRVLDADSARVTEVPVVVREPEFDL